MLFLVHQRTSKKGNFPDAEKPNQSTTIGCPHRILTIQQIHVVHILVLVRACILLSSLLVFRGVVGEGHVQVAELAKVKELSVGEERQLGIEIERLILLDGLLVRGRDGVQILQVLREVGPSTPIVARHGENLSIEYRVLEFAEKVRLEGGEFALVKRKGRAGESIRRLQAARWVKANPSVSDESGGRATGQELELNRIVEIELESQEV